MIKNLYKLTCIICVIFIFDNIQCNLYHYTTCSYITLSWVMLCHFPIYQHCHNIFVYKNFKMSAQPEKRQGKKRKQNFTSAECSLLVDLVEKNLGTLRGQFSSTITNAKKQQLWETIASKINSLGYEKRTPAEVREKWRNMAQVAKKTNSGLLKSQRKTGGGPAEKPPTSTTAKIISLLGDEPSFSGIQGGFESESPSLGKFIAISYLCIFQLIYIT